MIQILYIGIGGFLGAVCRFITVKLFNNIFPSFPLGTLIVNVTGSFILGLLIFGIFNGKQISPEIRDLIIIGFIGAFTTMSTFAFESIKLYETSQFILFGLNLFLNVFLSLTAVLAGKELIIFLNK